MTSETPAGGAAELAVAAKAPARRSALALWLREKITLDEASQAAARVTSRQRELHRRGQRAFDLAEIALATHGQALDADKTALAADLFRQSVYWLLLSFKPELSGADSGRLVDANSEGALAPVLGTAEDAESLKALMLADFVAFADEQPDRVHASALRLKTIAADLQVRAQRPIWDFELARTVRALVAFLLVTAGLVGLTAALLQTTGKTNLAEGKTWRTSSTYAVCNPRAIECGGVATAIFFHTKEEDGPWIEYDLGAKTSFSSMTIANRSDAVKDRAVPLVVEVSNDRKKYREVIRRTEVFDTWQPKFARQRARYVRLRVTRKSILHLDAVEIHP